VKSKYTYYIINISSSNLFTIISKFILNKLYSIKFCFAYQSHITERTAKEILIRSAYKVKSKGSR